jgi:predicted site-specific integrase-resolvase
MEDDSMPAPTAEIKLRLLPEAAEGLRVAASTLRTWALSGRVPYIKMGKQLMFLESDIENLIRSSRVG